MTNFPYFLKNNRLLVKEAKGARGGSEEGGGLYLPVCRTVSACEAVGGGDGGAQRLAPHLHVRPAAHHHSR